MEARILAPCCALTNTSITPRDIYGLRNSCYAHYTHVARSLRYACLTGAAFCITSHACLGTWNFQIGCSANKSEVTCQSERSVQFAGWSETSISQTSATLLGFSRLTLLIYTHRLFATSDAVALGCQRVRTGFSVVQCSVSLSFHSSFHFHIHNLRMFIITIPATLCFPP